MIGKGSKAPKPMEAIKMEQVQAYRNLNNGLWSLRALVDGKWKVVGHCESCTLMGVSVRQSEKARQTVLRSGQRSVHCWVVGQLVAMKGFRMFEGRKAPLNAFASDMLPTTDEACARVTYNPHVNETLVYVSTGGEYDGSEWCLLTADKHMFVA